MCIGICMCMYVCTTADDVKSALLMPSSIKRIGMESCELTH